MSLLKTQFHDDSDADDEYERSLASPHLPTDSEISPTDSDSISTEHTPTTYGNMGDDHSSLRSTITDWTAEECADFVVGLGLRQYRAAFIENEIVGEALIALKHEELKEMGISSAGHRLTILKSVYETKVKQGVAIDPDHYIAPSADHNLHESATYGDITRLAQTIRARDERLSVVEAELRRVSEDYRRLREELLPIFKLAKDRSQPLPYQPPVQSGTTSSPEIYHDASSIMSPSNLRNESSALGRSLSRRVYNGVTTPQSNNSPTHIPPSIHEGRPYNDGANIDPSAAAMAASTHLTASMNGGAQTSPGIPSPTSPGQFGQQQQQTLGPRSYVRDNSKSSAASIRPGYEHEEAPQPNPTPVPTPTPSASSRSESRNTDSSAPSVEIFKSFRVSMDDPCHKVLPAALKKYNINADWRQYALYIVYGDQERCLALDEKPLILFKQLDREGRKPMFMLRKSAPSDGTAASYPGSGGSAPNSAVFDGKNKSTVPGGVL
ncbi:MAPKKK cascade protein kinase regulator Ste50 [Talaromyces stipitatus ATCC 10500]|uniref:MAPKKK cascade protein kinase regulator Ste50 n=1 Tax=Talaromyces stipitatus (strain ATCC 10500 / CBS 375.48 / QM 6759 / NRRL 1006) TaxID=441959 RepID=B8LYC1_TALSN|nr:MAPKKK cascade protein kinase regulator Ste50 [Talaromyces stipitatus ATCC 10500]EED22850.1 MAPKKK cascade protein kinase regulator Ste50 [Talaromyces stipitatus ATCC 10500]